MTWTAIRSPRSRQGAGGEAHGARKRVSQARVKAGTRQRAKGEAVCGPEEICSTMAGSSRSSGSCGEAHGAQELVGNTHELIVAYHR